MKSFMKFVPLFALVLASVPALAEKSEGCHLGACIGDRAVNLLRNYREVTIVGIEPTGRFILRFEDTGGVGGNWDRTHIALRCGCSQDLCVGDVVVNLRRDYRRAMIHAIEFGGQYVLRFLDTGGVGGNWNRWDLVRANTDPKPPIPHFWECTIYKPDRAYTGRGPNRGAATSAALRGCAMSGRYACRATEAVCRFY